MRCFALCLCLLAFSGCSNGNRCATTLADLTCGSDTNWCCPGSFDGDETQLPACSGSEDRSTWSCGDLRALRRYWGTHDIVCYYASSTGDLVGGERSDDVFSYCGQTSYTESAGQTPSCGSGPPVLVCTDASPG